MRIGFDGVCHAIGVGEKLPGIVGEDDATLRGKSYSMQVDGLPSEQWLLIEQDEFQAGRGDYGRKGLLTLYGVAL